jgi:hypothetical protein
LAELEAGHPVDPDRLLAEHPAIVRPASGLPGQLASGRARRLGLWPRGSRHHGRRTCARGAG